MMRQTKMQQFRQRELPGNRKCRRAIRARFRLEALECRAVPTASLSANGFGTVMFLSQTSGSTVGLSFDASSDTYTFTSTEGVSNAGTVPLFTYTQVDANTATLQATDKSAQDFASLTFDQSVENISYNINSLDTPTNLADFSLDQPTGTPLTDNIVISPGGTAAASILANVAFEYDFEFPAITINDSSDTHAQAITIGNHQTTFGSVSYSYLTTRNFGSLSVEGGTTANSISVSGTPSGSSTTPATTTYESNVSAGELVNVIGTGQNGPLVLSGLRPGSLVTVGAFDDLSSVLANVSITNSFGVGLTINNTANSGNFNALLDSNSVTGINSLTGLSPAAISYGGLNLSGLTIDTGPGSNVITVNMGDTTQLFSDMTNGLTDTGFGDGSQLVLENGFLPDETYVANTPGSAGGVITFTTSASSILPITFSGLQTVDDLVETVDYTFPVPYTGGQGSVVDLLNGPTVNGGATAQITNPGSTPLFTTINFANKHNVTIDLNATSPSGASESHGFVYDNTNTAGQQTLDVVFGAANDNASIVATAPGVATTISMGGGDDTVSVTGAGLASGTTSSNFTVDGGPGDNTLLINATGTTATFSPTSPPAAGDGIVTFGDPTSFTYLNFTSLSELAGNTAPTIVTPPHPSLAYYVGVPLDGVVVGAFTDPDLIETAASYSATIDWADGSQSAGTISPDPNSPAGVNEFFVTGSHTYSTFPSSSSNQITISVTDSGGSFVASASGSPVPVQMPAVVNPTTGAPVVTTGNGAAASTTVDLGLGPIVNDSATAGTLVALSDLVTFTDDSQFPATTDFTASIDWGDGTPPSAGTITNTDISGTSFYTVAGSHTYAGPIGRVDTVSISISYLGQVQAVATLTMSVNGLTVNPLVGLHALAGTPTGALTVADFTALLEPEISGYTALVDFGDGSPAATATIGSASPFSVSTSGHTYAQGGSYTIGVTIRDTQGFLVGTATAGIVVNVNSLSGRLSPQSDTGVSDTDGITSDTTPTFDGITTPGTTVEVFAAPLGSNASPGSMIAIGVANAAGYWTATVENTPLADGSYTITALAVNSAGDVLNTASLGTVVIDTVGPVITALSFNRFDDTLTATYQDNLSGLATASIENGVFDQFSAKPLSRKVPVPKLLLVTRLVVTPGASPTDPVEVQVVFNHGRTVRGGRYSIVIDSGSGDSGVHDVAGNALDGNFYGTFPSGDGLPGGNFDASIVTFHNHITLAPVPFRDGYVSPGKAVIDPKTTPKTSGHAVKLARPKTAPAVARRPVSLSIVTRDQAIDAMIDEFESLRPPSRRGH